MEMKHLVSVRVLSQFNAGIGSIQCGEFSIEP